MFMNNPLDEKHFSLNTNALLTEQQQSDIAALKTLSDADIDYSDIPPLTEELHKRG